MNTILVVSGLSLGVLASVLLSLSLGRLVSAVVLSITAFDTTLQTYFSDSPGVPVFTGLEHHVGRGVKRARRMTVLGFLLLGVSFVLQAVALLV